MSTPIQSRSTTPRDLDFPEKFSYKEIFGDIQWSDVKPYEIIKNDATIQTSMEIDNKADAFTMRSEAPPTTEALGLENEENEENDNNKKALDSNDLELEEKLAQINIDFTKQTAKLRKEKDKEKEKQDKNSDKNKSNKKNAKRKRTVFVSIKVKRLSNVDSVAQTAKLFYFFFFIII